MNQAIRNFCDFYQHLGPDNLDGLVNVYSDDVVFTDPVHCIEGFDNLNNYFKNLFTNVTQCRFDIHSVIEQDQEAYVNWTMEFSHPKLAKGNKVSVPGVTHLKFTDLVNYHRDYMDMGTMLYEHVPVLGNVVKILKARMSR